MPSSNVVSAGQKPSIESNLTAGDSRSLKSTAFVSSSVLNAIILAAAVLIGGWLRFRDLGALDLTADEAPSWLAASAPTVGQVIHQGLFFNPGKLAAHDLALHFWMLAFGDSVISIRALSALLGTIVIALVFLVTRELFATEKDIDDSLFAGDRSVIAALSAFVFAINLVAVRYSREGRMYELMLAATLLQVWFFLRAVRRAGFSNYIGVALFSILATAASFVAVLVFMVEAAGLLFALRPDARRWPYAWQVTMALVAAGAIVACLTPWRLWVENPGFFSWIKPGYLSDYVAGFLRPALYSPIVYLTLTLATWGAIRGWRKCSEGVCFALLWMFLPLVPLVFWLGPMMLTVDTIYSWTPLFTHRWALSCIVPTCMLIGLGIWELRIPAAQVAALVLLIVFAGIRIHSYDPTAGDVEWGVQWREATAAVLPELKAGRPVNVVPSYGKFAVIYYSRNDHVSQDLLTADDHRAQMLILADTAETLFPQNFSRVRRYYPLQVARLRGVTVLATPMAVNPTGVTIRR
jgi:uncharacterized membrane protein